MLIYSKHKMTAMKKPEDLTLDEVREQMALYQRLYYKLRMQDPDYATAVRERKRLRSNGLRKPREDRLKCFLVKNIVWRIWRL